MHGHMAGREKSPAFSEPWQELCIAIVRKAADDYIDVLRKLWKSGVSVQAKRKLLKDKIELESFFHSEWYEFLCDIPPEKLMRGCISKAKELEKEDHLYILWTNADPATSEHMVLMYETNALLRGWWKKVTVIVWGGSQKTLLENEGVKLKFKLAKQAGVEFTACIACAANQGLTERLQEEGIEVIPWGELLSELIKERYHLLSV